MDFGSLLRLGVDRASLHSDLVARTALGRKTDAYMPMLWEMRLMSALPNGERAIDVGAHIGMMTALLADRHEEVIALEPNDDCLIRLRHTMPDNVVVVGAAAGAAPGTAELEIPVHNGRGVAALGSLAGSADPGTAVRSRRVAVLRVDDIVSDPVDFIKIDVEGFEPEVLTGAERVLSSRPGVLIEAEERHRQGVCSTVGAIMKSFDLTGFFVADGQVHGFDTFDPEVHQKSPPSVSGEAPPDYATNFLFVPTEDAEAWVHRLKLAAGSV